MVFREIDDDLWEIVQKYLPPTKPHIGRLRCDPRGLFNGILYVLTTRCTWLAVPAKYGTKSTVHRYHLELCEMLFQNAVTGRGYLPPGPSPEWRYPMGSRFTLFVLNVAQMVDI